MSLGNGIDGAALDRYLTGNWGEDSVREMPVWCEECDSNEDCEIDPDTCREMTMADMKYDMMVGK